MAQALPLLELRCLGPPSVRVDGREPPPDVLWRKHLALLVYLALSPDRTRSRSHLMGLLWAERPEDNFESLYRAGQLGALDLIR